MICFFGMMDSGRALIVFYEVLRGDFKVGDYWVVWEEENVFFQDDSKMKGDAFFSGTIESLSFGGIWGKVVFSKLGIHFLIFA